jgi:hypothetical protein
LCTRYLFRKLNNFRFWEIYGYPQATSNLFGLFLLFLNPGSGIEKNQYPRSRINIPDTQHWSQVKSVMRYTLTLTCVVSCYF